MEKWFKKNTEFGGYDPFTSEPRIEIVKQSHKGGSRNEIVMPPEMADFFSTIKIDTDKKAYLLINVMGASDYYGCNLNGDWFDEEDLIKYHKTFEQGHVFSNHKNDDPSKAFGRILFASYNMKMHRVELLVEIFKDDPRAQKVLSQIEAGILPKVSMGCRVMFDECLICKTRARTRDEYCVHARDGRLGKLNPDGTRNAVRNPNPRFFDLSFVFKEADEGSSFMAKVASSKACIEEKESAMDKEIEGGEVAENIEDAVDGTKKIVIDEAAAVDNCDDVLPEELLDLMSGYSFPEICSTMSALKMKLKPEEFTYLAMKPSVGRGGAALLLSTRHKFGPVVIKKSGHRLIDYDRFYNPSLGTLLTRFMDKRSFYPAFVSGRPMSKEAGATCLLNNPQLASIYGSYIADLQGEHPSKLANFMDKNQYLKMATVGLDVMEDDISRYKTASSLSAIERVAIAHKMLLGALSKEVSQEDSDG